jgi:hypothetical protein
MAQTILMLRAAAAGNVPASLQQGQLAIDALSPVPKLYTQGASARINLLDLDAITGSSGTDEGMLTRAADGSWGLGELADAPTDQTYGRVNGDWVPVVRAQGIAPPAPNLLNDLWYDTATATLKIYNGTAFVPVVVGAAMDDGAYI